MSGLDLFDINPQNCVLWVEKSPKYCGRSIGYSKDLYYWHFNRQIKPHKEISINFLERYVKPLFESTDPDAKYLIEKRAPYEYVIVKDMEYYFKAINSRYLWVALALSEGLGSIKSVYTKLSWTEGEYASYE